MTDFPRGWTLSSSANPAVISMPGITGLVHVLDSVQARLFSFAAAAAGGQVNVIVNVNGVVLITWGLVIPAGYAADDVSFSGLDLSSGSGGGIQVQFSGAAPANIAENLVIQGHSL